jgi:hypothetical protein
MVGKSFGMPSILFYLASDANFNKRGDDLNLEKLIGYPAQPGLILLSVRPSVRTCLQIRYSAENCTGPTDWVNYSLKSLRVGMSD